MRVSLRRGIVLSVLIVSSIWHATAQIDALLSQYFSVPVYYNAASVGNTNMINISAAGQMKNGSDKYAHLSTDMPFYLNSAHRIGGGITADYVNTALWRNMNFSLPLAWKFLLGSNEISIGIAPGITESTLKQEQHVAKDENVEEANDDSHLENYKKTWFDLSGGIWFQSHYFRTGISFRHTGDKKMTDHTGNRSFPNKTAYYFMVAGNIPIKSSLLDMEPSAIFMLSSGKLLGQATLRSIWKKHFWIGAGYRLHENAVVMAGIEVKGFKAGYSFLLPHRTEVHNEHKCRHELVAGYSIPLEGRSKKLPRHKSVRLM